MNLTKTILFAFITINSLTCAIGAEIDQSYIPNLSISWAKQQNDDNDSNSANQDSSNGVSLLRRTDSRAIQVAWSFGVSKAQTRKKLQTGFPCANVTVCPSSNRIYYDFTEFPASYLGEEDLFQITFSKGEDNYTSEYISYKDFDSDRHGNKVYSWGNITFICTIPNGYMKDITIVVD